MCMLTYLPAGLLPDPEALARGADFNGDGHGYAIVTTRGILIGKSFNFDESLEKFTALRRQHPNGPALFHSRLGTHGKITKANIHPFRVNRQASTVLAHNGILDRSVQPGPRHTRSDTRIFAEDHLGTTIPSSFDNLPARLDLERWLGEDVRHLVRTGAEAAPFGELSGHRPEPDFGGRGPAVRGNAVIALSAAELLSGSYAESGLGDQPLRKNQKCVYRFRLTLTRSSLRFRSARSCSARSIPTGSKVIWSGAFSWASTSMSVDTMVPRVA